MMILKRASSAPVGYIQPYLCQAGGMAKVQKVGREARESRICLSSVRKVCNSGWVRDSDGRYTENHRKRRKPHSIIFIFNQYNIINEFSGSIRLHIQTYVTICQKKGSKRVNLTIVGHDSFPSQVPVTAWVERLGLGWFNQSINIQQTRCLNIK